MRSKARGAAFLSGALILLAAGWVGLLHWRALRKIEAFGEETARRLAERSERGPSRPAVFGEPLEGDAWGEYVAAAAGLRHRLAPSDELGPPEQTTDDLLRRLLPELTSLRRGLRTRFAPPLAEGDVLEQLAKACVLLDSLGERLLKEGRPFEALDLLSVRAGLAYDALRLTGPRVGVASYLAFNVELWRKVLESRALDAAQLKDLASRVEGLRRTAPSSLADGVADRFLASRRRFHEIVLEAEFPLESRSWRQLWSRSIVQARALNAYDDYAEAWKRVGETPPERRGEALEQLPDAGSLPIPAGDFVSSLTEGDAFLEYVMESSDLLSWRMIQIALAVARHHAELGRFPAALSELVPVYLAEPPGADFTFSDGTLEWGDPADPDAWAIRRTP